MNVIEQELNVRLVSLGMTTSDDEELVVYRIDIAQGESINCFDMINRFITHAFKEYPETFRHGTKFKLLKADILIDNNHYFLGVMIRLSKEML